MKTKCFATIMGLSLVQNAGPDKALYSWLYALRSLQSCPILDPAAGGISPRNMSTWLFTHEQPFRRKPGVQDVKCVARPYTRRPMVDPCWGLDEHPGWTEMPGQVPVVSLLCRGIRV